MASDNSSIPPGSPLHAEVSVFRGSTNATPVETALLSAILQRIKDGTYGQYVAHLREILATEGKKRYDAAKRRSIGFTPCGIFTHRANDHLTMATGLVQYDLDSVPNVAEARALLSADPHVVSVFVSPSGNGVKVTARAHGIVDDASYKRAWFAGLAYLTRQYPALVQANDASCKDIARLCYTSFDPECYHNPGAQALPVSPEPAPQPKPARTRSTRQASEQPPATGETDPARVEAALQHIPADDYYTWLTIGMALHSTAATWARTTWDTWSQRSEKYDSATQESTWSSFTADGGVTIGTLFHLANEHGYLPPVPAIMAVTNGAPALPTPASNGGTLPYSDYTNARAFVRDHGANLRYCHPWGKWLVWTGTHWDMEATGQVMRWAKETIKRLARQIEHLSDSEATALLRHIKASLSTAKLKAMVENAESELPLPVLPEALDRDPWLLNVANGTLDLRTGALQPHLRADMLTRCMPVAYEHGAPCPTWERFLWRIMGGTDASNDSADDSALALENRQKADERAARLIAFLQRAVGYALTGVIREHVLPILWGSGRNGKSTFLNTLRALLGPYAVKASAELLMVSNSDRHPTERTDLFQKRFVAVIETEQGRRMAEVFVKEATGGDPIRARRMREDMWEFQPTHKLFLATNHKPTIKGTDDAIWERMKLVEFTVTIPAKERDTRLPEKLQAELPGILAWAVRGCRDWQQHGLAYPDEVTKTTGDYRAEMDVLGRFLKEECYLEKDATGNDYKVASRVLRKAYQQWSGDTSISEYDFAQRLQEKGYQTKREKTGMFWQRIGLPASFFAGEDRKDLEK